MSEHRVSNAPSSGASPRPGWTDLPEEHLPTPTFWPAGLGMGITFIFWGLISSWVVLAMGLAAFVAALAGWIRDIRHERRTPHT